MFNLNKIAMAAAVLAIGASAATASFAREAGEVRGEGAGHPVIDSQDATVAKREASEGPRGEGAGHPVIDSQSDVMA